MTPNQRLALFLGPLVGTVALTACGTGPLDDVACLTVPLDATCPDAAGAADQLIGNTLCESPVREITNTGELVSQEEVTKSSVYYYTYDTGEPELVLQCCYEASYKEHIGESCVIGRPLRDGGGPLTARPVRRAGWARGPLPDLSDLSAAARAELAERWTADALMEHASITAFARLAAELAAHGAPAELIARTAQAMSDEVVHAREAFALASAYAGEPVGPGALPALAPHAPDLASLAVESLIDGYVGETLAVARAAAQLRDATDPAVRSALTRIVADEARHAALGLDIARWALAVGGTPVREALARAAAELTLPQIDDGTWPAHGAPTRARTADVLAAALHEVIRPSVVDALAA